MKLYGKRSISEVLTIALNIVLLFGVVMTGKVYYTTFLDSREVLPKVDGMIMLLLLTIGIICTFLIVLDLKKVVKTLVEENPFTRENVRTLNKMAINCFIISGCYIVNIIYNMSKYVYRFVYIDNRGIHTDTEPVIFLLAGIFILVLAAVFKQAVKYKEENDYTI